MTNESYWAVLSCGAGYCIVQGGSNLSVWMKSLSVTIKMKAISSSTICAHMVTFFQFLDLSQFLQFPELSSSQG